MKTIFVITLIACLTGCATLQTWFSSPTAEVVIQAAVDIAVTTAEAKGVSALEINTVAKAALAADSGVTGTLAEVSTLLNAEIAKLKLPAGDQVAINLFEVALDSAIAAKIGNNATVAQAQADIASVLQDVILATS